MNENEKAFNKKFENRHSRIVRFIKENHWAIISFFLCMTIIFFALGFKDTKDAYAEYYLKTYLANNYCICSGKGLFIDRSIP
jgi:hypothetical protein